MRISRELMYNGQASECGLPLPTLVESGRTLFLGPPKIGDFTDPRHPDPRFLKYVKPLSAETSLQKAAKKAGIGSIGTHSMRHSYRSWLDSVGTPVGVQQKLMRHADIRTTMNTYGEAFTPDMSQAASKVAGLVLNGLQADCKPS